MRWIRGRRMRASIRPTSCVPKVLSLLPPKATAALFLKLPHAIRAMVYEDLVALKPPRDSSADAVWLGFDRDPHPFPIIVPGS